LAAAAKFYALAKNGQENNSAKPNGKRRFSHQKLFGFHVSFLLSTKMHKV